MQRVVALALLLPLLGCGPRTAAGRTEAAPQFWRPSATKEAWRIGGYLDTRRVMRVLASRPRHEVVITVNGEETLRSEMPRDRSIEMRGRAQGSVVEGHCSPRMVSPATVQVNCLVLVDNERAATLVFTAGTNPPRS